MQSKLLTNTGKMLAGVSLGFSLFWLTSHPKSKIKSRLPGTQYKKLTLLPNIRYEGDEKAYHLHHWLLLSICYVPLLRLHKFRKSKLLHGLLLGSIFQGLLYKDRFQFRYPKEIKEAIE